MLDSNYFTGSKCNGNVCDDVLLILVCRGVLPSEEIPHSLWFVKLGLFFKKFCSYKFVGPEFN